jgi:hypothetical protein
VNSGVLPSSQSSYETGALPTGETLYATIYTEINGSWSYYRSISFTAAAVPEAAFTYPTDGQQNVDTTQPFTWSTAAGAQGYYFSVGTSQYGQDVVNSGVLPSSQSSYETGALPTGETLYATIYTEINGSWSYYRSITFTAAAAGGGVEHASAMQPAARNERSVPHWLRAITEHRSVPHWLRAITKHRSVPHWLRAITKRRSVPHWLRSITKRQSVPRWLHADTRRRSVAHRRT